VTSQEYYDEFVGPAWDDYLNNKSSRRYAALVAVVAYHMLDYIRREKGPSFSHKDIFEMAEKGEPYLGIIQQIADAFKHSERTRPQKGKVAAKVVTEIIQISPTYNKPWASCVFWVDNTGWRSDYLRLTIRSVSGAWYDFECCMEKVVASFQQYLATGSF